MEFRCSRDHAQLTSAWRNLADGPVVWTCTVCSGRWRQEWAALIYIGDKEND